MTNSAERPINHIYTRPGYTGPFPVFTDTWIDPTYKIISERGSKPIVQLSAEAVVKFGSHVSVNEAESLLLVEKAASNIPIPRLYACYSVGPYDRDPDDYGSLYDTFIIMQHMAGDQLSQVWSKLGDAQKSSIADQLSNYMRDLRAIPPIGLDTFCNVTGGPLTDRIFMYHTTKGPFRSETDFNAALAAIQEKSNRHARLRFLIEGALEQHKHQAVFTHGDLMGRNILVKEDKIIGIVDWETSGFYPEYWEFARCFGARPWPADWPEFVARILQPYYLEWIMLDVINEHVY